MGPSWSWCSPPVLCASVKWLSLEHQVSEEIRNSDSMPVEEEDMYEELGSEEWCDSGGTGGGRSGGGGGGGSLCGGGGAGRGLSCFLDMPGED